MPWSAGFAFMSTATAAGAAPETGADPDAAGDGDADAPAGALDEAVDTLDAPEAEEAAAGAALSFTVVPAACATSEVPATGRIKAKIIEARRAIRVFPSLVSRYARARVLGSIAGVTLLGRPLALACASFVPGHCPGGRCGSSV
jgi:hypothetical protein